MFHCRPVRHSYGLDTIYVMPRVVSLSAQKAGTEEARNVSLMARVKHQSRLVDFLPLSVTSATCMGSNTNCISPLSLGHSYWRWSDGDELISSVQKEIYCLITALYVVEYTTLLKFTTHATVRIATRIHATDVLLSARVKIYIFSLEDEG